MGFFKKLFKKRDVVEKEVIVEEKRSMTKEEMYLELWNKITWEQHSDIIQEIISDPIKYSTEHEKRYEARGLDLSNLELSKREGFAMIDELIALNYLREFDYNVELEDFKHFFMNLKTVSRYPNLEIMDLDDSEDLEVWIETINKEWNKQGYHIYQFDIDSDSYILFVSKIEEEDLSLYNDYLGLPLIDTAKALNIKEDKDYTND